MRLFVVCVIGLSAFLHFVVGCIECLESFSQMTAKFSRVLGIRFLDAFICLHNVALSLGQIREGDRDG